MAALKDRIYNFSAGPATMPLPVLEQAREEFSSYQGQGLSVMEMSHRSPVYEAIIQKAEADIRRLADIPEEYAVLFLQGGATLQFAMAPLNLSKNGKADYLVTGLFADKAAKEARRFLDVHEALNTKDMQHSQIPSLQGLRFRPDADFVHLCHNNTAYGTQFKGLPDTAGIPLVADVSSDIFSQPFDIRDYGLIYAGAQKNLGPAGLTLVILKKDLVREELGNDLPTMLRYHTHLKDQSMHNTPPTYSIYLAGLVVQWLLGNGGLAGALARNRQKAALLYDFLDTSRLFKGFAHQDSRSLMNVTFGTGDQGLDKAFVAAADQAGLIGLAGHRALGGMRASIYNAMELEGVLSLVGFMEDFERKQQP